MENLLGNLLNYGLPGAALGISLVVGFYARKNENKINNLKEHDVKIDTKLESMDKKLDKIVNNFIDKGMKR